MALLSVKLDTKSIATKSIEILHTIYNASDSGCEAAQGSLMNQSYLCRKAQSTADYQ